MARPCMGNYGWINNLRTDLGNYTRHNIPGAKRLPAECECRIPRMDRMAGLLASNTVSMPAHRTPSLAY